MSDLDDGLSDDNGSQERLHQPSLSRKMRRSITKVKKSIQRMTEDSHDEEEEEMARRILSLPRDNLATLTCRTGFSRDEVRRLYRAFKHQCPNGVATIKDLTPAYAKLFPLGDPRKYAEIVFNSFDEDRDGLVSFGDLLKGLASIIKGDADQKLAWIFRLYDLNGDGSITKQELKDGLSAIYEMVRSAQTVDCTVDKHVSRLFKKMDLNCDNIISRDEFFHTCKNDQMIYEQLTIFDDMQY